MFTARLQCRCSCCPGHEACLHRNSSWAGWRTPLVVSDLPHYPLEPFFFIPGPVHSPVSTSLRSNPGVSFWTLAWNACIFLKDALLKAKAYLLNHHVCCLCVCLCALLFSFLRYYFIVSCWVKSMHSHGKSTSGIHLVISPTSFWATITHRYL